MGSGTRSGIKRSLKGSSSSSSTWSFSCSKPMGMKFLLADCWLLKSGVKTSWYGKYPNDLQGFYTSKRQVVGNEVFWTIKAVGLASSHFIFFVGILDDKWWSLNSKNSTNPPPHWRPWLIDNRSTWKGCCDQRPGAKSSTRRTAWWEWYIMFLLKKIKVILSKLCYISI